MANAGKYFLGFSHLIGEEVAVLADGVVHDNVTVDEFGGIELDYNATEVIAGLPYTPIIIPMRVEAGGEVGSSQGDVKRIHRLLLELYKTGRVLAGYDENSAEALELDSSLVTDHVLMDFPSSLDEQGRVYITSDRPLPLTINMIGFKGVTYAQ